jgi:hypothetical protein
MIAYIFICMHIGRVPRISDTAIESLLQLVIENTSAPKIENKKGGSVQAELSLVLMTVASGKMVSNS